MNRRNLGLALAALGFMVVGAVGYAQLDKVLKGGAIAFAVDRFGPQIDKGINTLVDNRNLRLDQATKVVPILSIGNGSFVGAVQVTGPQESVDKVKAVAQLETNIRILGTVRIKALIPIEARSVTNLKRVPGVGVSALVDIKL
jgi:hypothetical protein